MLTIKVLARPGTPTSRQCPRVKMAAKICSITSFWPTMTFCKFFLHQPAMLAEFLQDVAETAGFDGGQGKILMKIGNASGPSRPNSAPRGAMNPLYPMPAGIPRARLDGLPT